jgi:hypothetical protein
MVGILSIILAVVPLASGSEQAANSNGGPEPTFAGSGVLVHGPHFCWTMFVAEDGSGAYTLDNGGDFAWGDYVYVTGTINYRDTCLPGFVPRIESNTIARWFSGCGTLERGPQHCLLVFVPDDGSGTFVLDDEGDFWWGDHVHVAGWVGELTWHCFPSKVGTIRENTIAPCFTGCGRLIFGPQGCPALQTDTDELYVLEDTGDFEIGDRVLAEGAVDEESTTCFPYSGPGLLRTRLWPCPPREDARSMEP